MTLDVIIAYYKQGEFAPFVLSGLDANKDAINHVYIVNDERWIPNERVLFDRNYITLLDHEHDGFGLCKSLNQGAYASKSELLLFCEGDEIIPPKMIETNIPYIRKHELFCGPKQYLVKPYLAIETPEFISTEEEDHRVKFLPALSQPGNWWWNHWWILASGGHLMVFHSDHNYMGGFNESFDYGLHDFDYAARWLMKFGMKTIKFIANATPIWHIGTGKNRENPSAHSKKLFETTMAKFCGIEP